MGKNPAEEEFALVEIVMRLPAFAIRDTRSLRDLYKLLKLPRHKRDMTISRSQLRKYNKALALELMIAAGLSAIDKVHAKPNCTFDDEGRPSDYAPAGSPDIEVHFKEPNCICEVSSTISGYSKGKPYVGEKLYIANLESAVKHLNKLKAPAFCLHVTNQSSPVRREQLEKHKELKASIQEREQEGKCLIHLSIEDMQNCLSVFSELTREDNLISEKRMVEWLNALHTESMSRLYRDPAEITRKFLQGLTELEPRPPEDDSGSPSSATDMEPEM